MIIVIDEIVNNYSDKDIAHIFSIVLRAWYEKKMMDAIGIDRSFELKQMEGFTIKYRRNTFELIFKKQKVYIKKNEISDLAEYIYKYFEKKYPINYNYKLINPIYFSLFFYDLLDKIILVKYDIINISNIRLLRYKSEHVKMEESERYKALINKNYKMYSPFKSNLTINTPEKRLQNILESIIKNGYGYNEEYAIFYNDEPYIRDGQHRVASLKYLYGDIDIKIIRIYLKNNYFYN